MGQWIVGTISFQKIFVLCRLKGHICSGQNVGCYACPRTTNEQNVKIELKFWETEFAKQLQKNTNTNTNTTRNAYPNTDAEARLLPSSLWPPPLSGQWPSRRVPTAPNIPNF